MAQELNTLQALQPIFREMGELVKLSLQARMKSRGLKDSALIESVTYELNGNAVDILANFYLQYVDHGRLPGTKRVPHQALVGWIQRKKIRGRNKLGRFITVNQLAWIIQTAIFKNGIKPRPFLLGGLDDAMKAIDELFNRVLPVVLDSQLSLALDLDHVEPRH